MMKAYETIRAELETYSKEAAEVLRDPKLNLSEKKEIILLTKTDTVPEEVVETTVKKFKKLGKPVFAVTLFDDSSVKEFQDQLVQYLKKEE